MAGMRDKLIHDYFGVDVEQVWYKQAMTSQLYKLRSKKCLITCDKFSGN